MIREMALLVALGIGGAADATTYTLQWGGIDGRTITNPSYTDTYFATERGSGSFTLKDGASGSGGIADLASFSFTTNLTYSDVNPYHTTDITQSVTYTLASLTSFSTVGPASSLDQVTFTTSSVRGTGGLAEDLQDNGFLGISTLHGTPLTPIGNISFSPSAPSVPEPTAWALMLAGFGLIGWTIRQQRPSKVDLKRLAGGRSLSAPA